MRTAGITAAALAASALMFLGKERDPRFYLAALPALWALFLLSVGRSCPAARLLARLGFCPACAGDGPR